ncbi:MAG: UDP-N-acetylmuramoyl-L-alanine--D-glutamate ligase [Patescibacteria group bacterium]|jgi:UDP-N-acetylmuramoylalanine--D-glutamate ligase|nr:UDP-N-acetylmuramoyl-L-alanine--D-glutamate ligase [Patescibacteria group bacterium]
MSITRFKNKNIAFLGLGAENEALVDFLLKKKVDCNISVFDSRDSKILGQKYAKYKNKKNIYWNLTQTKNNFSDFDILFRSPGWPLFDEDLVNSRKKNKNLVISSPMNLFFEICPSKNIVGVTGTKGKGTTSSLIYEIIKASKKKVFLGGNIGIAPFSFIDKIAKNDWVVLELSSFQLEDIKYSPRISVLVNLFKDHLSSADPNNPNYHKTFGSYWKAKTNIFRFQKNSDKLIANIKLVNKLEREAVTGERIFFHKSEWDSKLIGDHNKENIAAGIEVARILKIKKEIIEKAVKNFSGLEHRLEFVRELKGIKYYNDTFATTPESTITALKSFSEPIVSLMGGADKGSEFRQLAREIKKRVKFVILFDGKGSDKIRKELFKIKYSKENIQTVKSIDEAFRQVKLIASEGDVVLLSTACASFGIFKSYKERGKLFKEEVKKMK